MDIAVFCIDWRGHPLDDDICAILFFAAQKMLAEKRSEYRISEDWCEGKIQTNFKTISFAGVAGPHFKANVAWGNKQVEVEYVIRKNGQEPTNEIWSSYSAKPIPFRLPFSKN